MGKKGRKAAQALVSKASLGVIRIGHLGIYEKLQKDLHAARERLAGREELLQFDEIRRALDAKIEELTAVLQDPSVADHVAICEGVYKLLRECQPLYLALSEGLSVKDACDALDAAGAVLDGFADEDAAYKEYRRLKGGWVRDPNTGKRVKLNAKAFAKWQAAQQQALKNFADHPYEYTAQTPEAHIKAVSSDQKKTKRRHARERAQTKRARLEEPPLPKELVMRVTGSKGAKSKKYCVQSSIFVHAPKGSSNGWKTKEKAMELAELCLANRPAGTTREEMQAARAQKGLPHGVYPFKGRFRVNLRVKKRFLVTLEAPGGGCFFASAKAAGEAIKKYKKAGSPTIKSHPLVLAVYRSSRS